MVMGVGFVILLLVLVIIAVDRHNRKKGKAPEGDNKTGEGSNT